MTFTLPRGATTVALALLLAAACGGDDVLGPPDALRCVDGTLAAGRVDTARVGAASCTLWSDYLGEFTPAASWTLRTRPNTAYIVRMTPIAGANGLNTLAADLDLYGRNAQGDATFATGNYASFGPTNGNGGRGEQLVIASRRAAVVSVRVQSHSAADSGSYSLEVIACPLVAVAQGATSPEVTLDDDCTLRTGLATDSVRVAFFSYPAGTDEDVDVIATRTAGDATMRLRVRGPDLDVACYGSECTSSLSVVGAGPFTLQPAYHLDGHFTAILTQESAGTLTATLRVTSPLVSLTDAPTSAR